MRARQKHATRRSVILELIFEQIFTLFPLISTAIMPTAIICDPSRSSGHHGSLMLLGFAVFLLIMGIIAGSLLYATINRIESATTSVR